ncbi:TolC family outer membrane protein [Thiomicrospira microaerophila]|uniref:TolC family outer membrane protein n=1 Tax=Thiomicrospira microaerophila TaxID=406020 RepID=UPI0005CB2723|nr:TolC family outer membrane protein [Thiomicrospira microaerophila]
MRKKLACWVLIGSFVAPAYSMTLEETVSEAIVHNPEFRAEVKRYHGLQAEVRGAKSDFYPTIDLLGGVGYEEVNNAAIDNVGDGLIRRETSIRLTQNLFEGFGTQYEVQRLQYRVDAQSYTVMARANDTALLMAEAYIDLITEQELLKLAQDNKDTHQRILAQIIQRNDAGIGNLVEVDQARARLALAESNYAAVQNNYFDAKARFRRVLGRDPDNILVRPVFRASLPSDLETATQMAMQDHPTLRSASGDIAETRAQYKAADRFNYPRFDLEVERTFDRNLGGVEGKNENLQVMLRMRYNLYRGGRDSAEKRRTVSAYQEASEIRDNTRRQVVENLRYAWNAQVYVGRQLNFIEQHIKLTYDTLTGYRQQFTLGRRSLLDLLNTENEYYGATRNLISSEAELLKAQYRILAAMGHLLPSLDIAYGFIHTQDHPDE